VSSQRIREQRIVERLHAGALALASPSDTSRPNPSGVGRCHGCLEAEADSLVGDHPWHALCVLFWQGRSGTLRDDRIPHTQPGRGVTPARPLWVIVVPVGRPDTYAALRRSFARSVWVDVVLDRRGGPSSSSGRAPAVDRRGPRRRRGDTDAGPVSAFRRAARGDDFEVYEATAPLPVRCPQCGVLGTVELPRFAEPPVRLELAVVHEIVLPTTVQHVVDLQSLSATGRVLTALRLRVRPRTEPT